jgi:hypothetical protein
MPSVSAMYSDLTLRRALPWLESPVISSITSGKARMHELSYITARPLGYGWWVYQSRKYISFWSLLFPHGLQLSGRFSYGQFRRLGKEQFMYVCVVCSRLRRLISAVLILILIVLLKCSKIFTSLSALVSGSCVGHCSTLSTLEYTSIPPRMNNIHFTSMSGCNIRAFWTLQVVFFFFQTQSFFPEMNNVTPGTS